MEIQTFGSGNEGERLVEILLKLFQRGGSSGIISSDKGSASCLGSNGFFEAPNIIALPAVQANGGLVEGGKGGFYLEVPGGERFNRLGEC